MAYSDKVIDHYENPRNVGNLDKDAKNVGTGMVGAPACGDVMRLQIQVNDNGVIEDAKFKTYGCFTSNTKINTPTHLTKINELNVGDEVLAWNGKEIVSNKIKDIISRNVPVDDLLVVTFKRETSRKNIKAGTFKLICTKEHVFWNANNKPILAKELVAGQELYEITEHELRKLTNVRNRDYIKEKNSKRMFKFNKLVNQSHIPYIDLFEKHNVAARYAAGNMWVQSSTGPVSPDFIVPGKKKCIEVYTKNMPKLMQDRSAQSDYVSNRKEQLKTAGYDSLFLAIEDIDTALENVQNFIHNGMEVVSIEPISHGNQLRGCERNGNDVVVYDLKLEDGAHVYFANRVGSHNCGSAIASSSLLTEWVKGKTLDEASQIKNTQIAEELALPPVKVHCSVLAEDAIKAAIDDLKAKTGE